jgi:hypothetical protein
MYAIVHVWVHTADIRINKNGNFNKNWIYWHTKIHNTDTCIILYAYTTVCLMSTTLSSITNKLFF